MSEMERDRMPATGDARLAALEAAMATLQLRLPAQSGTRLLAYADLLQRWNKVYNLTALRDPAEILSHHLADCLAVLNPLRQQLTAADPQQAGARLLDVGSGGGLPGVVLALADPAWQVDCVDTVAKKVSFIRQVAAELRLPNLRGLHARVETLQAPEGGYRLITSRAFASLPDFTALTRHLLGQGGVWMAMKGKLPSDELAALPADVEVFHVEHLRVPGLDAQRCLVWMRPSPPTR